MKSKISFSGSVWSSYNKPAIQHTKIIKWGIFYTSLTFRILKVYTNEGKLTIWLPKCVEVKSSFLSSCSPPGAASVCHQEVLSCTRNIVMYTVTVLCTLSTFIVRWSCKLLFYTVTVHCTLFTAIVHTILVYLLLYAFTVHCCSTVHSARYALHCYCTLYQVNSIL